LAEPCPKPIGEGGMTIEEYRAKDAERVKRLEKNLEKFREKRPDLAD